VRINIELLQYFMAKTGVLLILIFFGFIPLAELFAQKQPVIIPKDSVYQSNIRKTHLYGVYIPRNIEDAMIQLDKLSTPEACAKMSAAEEKNIGKKLRFGIGRWMEFNWNLAEGSRLSHQLRQKGLTFTDDMVEYLIILYYRHCKNIPLDADNLANSIAEKRNKWLKQQVEQITLDTIK
jgi:hypothetical protein